MNIHPTAIVHPNAKIGKGTKIGAYSIVDENIITGEDCEIQEHVILRGNTKIGNKVTVYPFSLVGGNPQHLKYEGEDTTVEIGDGTVLRESVTVHKGTNLGCKKTVIGKNCLIMAYSHVAHDCIVGDNVILVNSVQLAGHVVLEDFVTIGGASEVAPYCRVGKFCFIGGGSTVRRDVPPFLAGKGNDFKVQGINLIGMQRQGIPEDTLKKLKTLYKIFYMQKNTVAQAIEKAVVELGDFDLAQKFIHFIQVSKNGFAR